MGKLVKCLTSDGSVTIKAIDSTDIAGMAETYHKTSAVVTAGLGRLLTAASLMGCSMKNEGDSLTLRLAGGGPAGQLIAISDHLGNARGSVDNPVVEIPLNAQGKLDVSGAVGRDGHLFVVRDSQKSKPYTGSIALASGEIAEDITAYYAFSEQTPTVCALGVLVNPDLTVKAAGGYLIQLLPEAGEDVIVRLEQAVQQVEPVSSMINRGMDPFDICQTVLKGFSVELLEDYEVAYCCPCSLHRVQGMLLSIGRQELLRLAQEDETTEVRCHFCDQVYRFGSEKLSNLAMQCE